jgi:hypothetical protein
MVQYSISLSLGGVCISVHSAMKFLRSRASIVVPGLWTVSYMDNSMAHLAIFLVSSLLFNILPRVDLDLVHLKIVG